MSTHTDHPELADYARRVRGALSALPEADRDGIVDEMRSHTWDRLDASVSLETTLRPAREREDA